MTGYRQYTDTEWVAALGAQCEGAMRLEADARASGDLLDAADWADMAESVSMEAFQLASRA